MREKKIYYFHRDPKTYQEAESFLQEYRRSIKRRFDRHMITLKHIPANSYVLDYGCGWGVFSEMMHEERDCQVDGIDLDAHSIEIARDFIREREGLSFSTKNIQEITDEIYDVVVSTEVIEHALNPGIYLKECNRVLKHNGSLIISLPNIMTPRHILATLFGNQEKKFRYISKNTKTEYDKTRHHIQGWDPAVFCRLVCITGFEYIAHEFMEGWALPKNRYWRSPWGKMKNLSYKMLFVFRKHKFVDIQPYE